MRRFDEYDIYTDDSAEKNLDRPNIAPLASRGGAEGIRKSNSCTDSEIPQGRNNAAEKTRFPEAESSGNHGHKLRLEKCDNAASEEGECTSREVVPILNNNEEDSSDSEIGDICSVEEDSEGQQDRGGGHKQVVQAEFDRVIAGGPTLAEEAPGRTLLPDPPADTARVAPEQQERYEDMCSQLKRWKPVKQINSIITE